MKSFKQHLKEFAVFSTSDYVFTFADHIPISGPMLKRIWPNTIRTTVFHATDLKGLERLARVEGSKKTISAFFSMQGKYMQSGIATGGGIVVEMEADVLVSARDDIMSKVDKTGRRWVELDWFAQASRMSLGRNEFTKIEKEFKKLKEDLVAKHVPHMANSGPLEVWKEMKNYLKYDGVKIAAVIKDYFDGVEKIFKKHEKIMGQILYGYAKSKRQTDNSWDEQIVNNIDVQKVHVIEVKGYEDEDMVYHDDVEKSSKWPTKQWDASIDLEIYTRQVAQAEIRTR